jgi:hypothetical protein
MSRDTSPGCPEPEHCHPDHVFAGQGHKQGRCDDIEQHEEFGDLDLSSSVPRDPSPSSMV